MITIINKDTLLVDARNYDAIIIGSNTYCSLGNGIQREVALDFPHADQANKKTRYGDPSKVGEILVCEASNEPTIVLAYVVKGFEKKTATPNYDGVENCLKKINVKFKGKKIGMTILGTSRFDGKLDKNIVMGLITKILVDCDVYVYDFEQVSRDEKQRAVYKKEQKLKLKDYKLYNETVKQRKKKAEERFRKNGHARY